MIPVFPDPCEHARGAEKIIVIRDAPIDSLPLHALSAVVANTRTFMGLSRDQRIFHRFPPVRDLILVKGTECAKAVSINITNKIEKIDVSLG